MSFKSKSAEASSASDPGDGLIGSSVLVAGASGDIGQALIRLLAPNCAKLGAHYCENRVPLDMFAEEAQLDQEHFAVFGSDLSDQESCHRLVDSYAAWAGGIDALVQLTGTVTKPVPWEGLSEDEWNADLRVNLNGPFFLAQRAMAHMKVGGGRVVLASTASAQHGGGTNTLGYGVAKAGVECLVKCLARDGAPHGILVNAVAPGFIQTQFHTRRAHKNAAELKKRAELVPLKRAGLPEDVARLIKYLLSAGGNYITGECMAVSGGDWL